MSSKMSNKKRATNNNVSEVPKQSGVYILHRGSKSKYVGSAGAGRLQERVKEQLKDKRGITSFQYRPTSSEKKARKLEKEYRDRVNPKQKRI
jgi:excinuclease UvrABC nuclease subunit